MNSELVRFGGRFSDRVGRRPRVIALGRVGNRVSHFIRFRQPLRVVVSLAHRAGGRRPEPSASFKRTWADSTDPKDSARALGWLSATTNLGVALGPVLGSFAIALGKRDVMPGPSDPHMGHAAPGINGGGACLIKHRLRGALPDECATK